MRAVIDTCVWVSAVRSRRGASFALLSEIPHRRFQFGISVPLFLEYKAKLVEVVEKAQTPLSRKQIDSILSDLAFYCTEVPIFFQLRPNLKDENDNMVFRCAANFGASKIITHNVKDFLTGELAAYELEIMTPGDFIRELRRTT